MSTACKNCGSIAEENFCPICGQSTRTKRIGVREIVQEFLHGIVHVDKGILYTIKALTLYPGKTIRGYYDGKRVRLFKPFGYFFVLATIYLLLSHWMKQPVMMQVNLVVDGDTATSDANKIEAVYKMIVQLIETRYSLIMLCTIPFLSAITLLLFRRQQYNYGEHLVMNSYILGHQILFSILLIPLSFIIGSDGMFYWTSLCQLAVFIYMIAAVFNTYKLWKRILYALVAYFIITLIIAAFIFGILLYNM